MKEDILAGTAVTTAATSWFVATLPVIQWFAAAVAIVAGILAIRSHLKRRR